MNAPELVIKNANLWRSPETHALSRGRFVTRYELECFQSKAGKTFIDGAGYDLTRGSVLFCRPGQVRFSQFPFQTLFVYFDAPSPCGELSSLLERIPPCTPPEAVPRAHEVMERLRELFGRGDYAARLEAYALLAQTLCALARLKEGNAPRFPLRHQKEIYQSICFMKENLCRPLSADEIAAAAGYSPQHFTALFRRTLGATPYDYFLRLKCQEAERRLRESAQSVQEIAEALGFSSPGYFCYAFRRACGQSPSAFRRRAESEVYGKL